MRTFAYAARASRFREFRRPLLATRSTGRHRRTVGRVERDGVDANAGQVSAGMAWVFDRYITDGSLYAIQDEARAVQPGLWAVKAQIPPWEWRRSKGDMQSSPRAARNINAPRKRGNKSATGANYRNAPSPERPLLERMVVAVRPVPDIGVFLIE
jgi:hypothetical protein